jgi:hypothetical protein
MASPLQTNTHVDWLGSSAASNWFDLAGKLAWPGVVVTAFVVFNQQILSFCDASTDFINRMTRAKFPGFEGEANPEPKPPPPPSSNLQPGIILNPEE